MRKLLFLLILVSGYPVFADYSTTEYTAPHAMGLKRDQDALKKLKTKHPHHMALRNAVIPGEFDLRTLNISSVENQLSCGSCWDFSLVKALRSAMSLAGHDPGQLSFNYLLGNCGGPVQEAGCNGGDFTAGENLLGPNLGDWSSASDPYVGYQVACKKGLPIIAQGLTWNVVGNGNSAPTFQDIASAISAKHFLSIDVAAACSDWADYTGGIYEDTTGECGADQIDHLVDLVGYSCETSIDSNGNCVFDSEGQPVNGDGYEIVQNNWGTPWGESGYMRTRWGANAVADTAMFFDVAPPTPSPNPPAPAPIPAPPVPAPAPAHFNYELEFLILDSVGVVLLISIVVILLL